MKVGEYLRVPYIVTAWSEELPDGRWVRHVEHPELPGCSAEAASIEEALSRLDDLRPRLILEMLADGRRPLMRKSLMGASQARVRLGSAGLLGAFDPVWDMEIEEMSGRDVSALLDNTA